MPITIEELTSEREKVSAKMTALAAGEITAESQAQFEAAKTEFDTMTAQLDMLKTAEAAAAAAAVPANDAVMPAGGGKVYAAARDQQQEAQHNQAVLFAALNMMYSSGNNNANAARGELPRYKGSLPESVYQGVENMLGEIAMTPNSASSGGVLIPQQLARDIIPTLFPASVIRTTNGGPSIVPVPNGNLSLGRMSSPPVAGYTGIAKPVKVTQGSTDKVELKAKKLSGLVPISNDLLRFAGTNPGIDQMIADELSQAMSAAADLGMIRGDGSGDNIKGLRYWAPSGNVISAASLAGKSTADGSLQQTIRDEVSRLKQLLYRANVRLTRPALLMHPDTFIYLSGLQTTTGAKVFPEVGEKMMFENIPIGFTTQIPINLTAGGATGNGSEIYLVDWPFWMIGDTLSLEVAFSREATYTDPGTGNPVNAFEQDEALLRMITLHDFAPRREVAVAVLNGVTWGR